MWQVGKGDQEYDKLSRGDEECSRLVTGDEVCGRLGTGSGGGKLVTGGALSCQ